MTAQILLRQFASFFIVTESEAFGRALGRPASSPVITRCVPARPITGRPISSRLGSPIFFGSLRGGVKSGQFCPLCRIRSPILQSGASDDAHFLWRIHHDTDVVLRSAQKNNLYIVVYHQIFFGANRKSQHFHASYPIPAPLLKIQPPRKRQVLQKMKLFVRKCCICGTVTQRAKKNTENRRKL